MNRVRGLATFFNDDDVKKVVEKWLKEVAANFYDYGIQKLVPRL